jgi:hypothetical protein
LPSTPKSKAIQTRRAVSRRTPREGASMRGGDQRSQAAGR